MEERSQLTTKSTVETAVKRIVDVVGPLRIILFGSAARGQLGSHSDLDMLVVVRTGTHRRRTAQRIYRALFGTGHAVDVVVVTEDDLVLHRHNAGMIIGIALEEGRELYAA